MKLLYILNVASKVNNFCMSSLLAAKELGIEYHIAGNWGYQSVAERQTDEQKYGVRIHQIDFIRSPFDIRNIKAFKQLRSLEIQEHFDAVHCNTPIGGLLGRLVFRKMPGVKIVYQVHGFHFYKGAPKSNWLLYYPIEKWLAHYSDALITINHEDYQLATSKFKLRNNGCIYYVSGVGLDTTQYISDETARQSKRKELGVDKGSVVLISMGDLNKNKDYVTAIQAVKAAKNANLQYFICGKGPEEDALGKLVKTLGITNQIRFLGFRSDVKELLCASDIFLFTSKREGLSRSMMEAMASGLPCIASNIRGNTDLLDGVDGGFLCQTESVVDFADKMNLLASDESLRKRMGENNWHAVQKFSMDTAIATIKDIYKSELWDV